MMSPSYAPLIILAVICVYVAFAVLKRATGASSLNEIEAAHVAEARSKAVQREADIAESDEDLADRLLPSHAAAMIIPLGAPMESEHATFEGSLSEARERVSEMTDAERAHIAIWTPGHIFTAADLLAEEPGHEHDPLTPQA